MRGLFTFALVLTLLSWKVCGKNCTIRAIFDDQVGDGWSHNYMSFQSNGQDLVVYDADGVAGVTATLSYGLRTVYTFNAIDSTPVTLQYHASGKYQSENLWTIQYDQDESPILHQGVGSSSDLIASFVPRCCCAPPQVTGLQVLYNADVPHSATLQWEALADAISYIVQRQSEDGSLLSYGEYQTNKVDLTLEPSQTYNFAVTAVSSFAHGPISDSIQLQSQDFESCTLTLQLYDNFDDATDQNTAYLSVQAGGLLAYEAFDSKGKTLDLQIPAIGDVLITPTLIAGGRDPTELEFLFKDAVTEYFHSGGNHFTTDTSFTVSCSAGVLSDGDNLLRNGKQHLLSQQAPFEADIVEHIAPTINTTRDLQATCQYALIMNDSRGNGWWGMSLSISLNGALWASPLYVPGQLSSFLWWFWLNDGTNVQVTFTRGTDPNPLDGSYSVAYYDGNVVGNTIVSSGGNGVLMSSTSFVSNCAGTSNPPTTQAPQNCPSTTTCNSLGRNPCQNSFNPRTCGTCRSGLVANDGTTNSNSNSQCSASPTSPPTSPPTSQCPSANTCSNLNRNSCQNNFSPRTCGTCLSGFTANDGTTNSNSNSACTQTQTCPTNCGSLNRNSCQNNFNPRTCGTCLSGFTASDGTTNSNSNSVCTQTQAQCPTNCSTLNRNACQNSFNPRTCGTCLSGYSATDGTSSSNSNTQCQDTNECNTSPCDSNARCTNTAGSFTCACNSGWTGDGFTCTQPQGCGQRIRREWFSLTTAQRQQFINAVNALYNQGQYAQFATVHSTYQSVAHGTALFLPWHREFLQWFEDTVRALGSPYTCFTIPYWDWTNSQNVQAIFTNSQSGGNYIGIGTKDGRCFSGSHPFAGFSYRGTCVSRSPMSTPNFPNAWTLATQLNTNFYSSIRPRIESYHNDLHVWVGNTMSQVPTSPADPVFWLHHAFVDQLWASWESCRGYVNPPSTTNAWESGSFGFDSVMPGWSTTPRQTWNLLSQYNVRYESAWLNRAFQGVTTFTCPASNQQFLAAYTSPAKVVKYLQDVNGTSRSGHKSGFYRSHSSFRPSRWYLAQQQSIYETFKDTYVQTQNATLALDKAFVKSCLMSPVISAADAQMFTPEMIVMMNFEDECAAGYCVRPCFQRLMADQP